MKRLSIYTISAIPLILFIFFGCEKKKKEVVTPPVVEEKPTVEEKPEEKVPVLLEGYIIYLSGNVFINRGSEWEPCDIDDFVGIEDRIKTEIESFCEVQFASIGTIRIQESTEVVMREIYLKEKQNSVDVNLVNGNLLSKVSKLAKGERFQVSTDTVLAGVRGTEFVVKTELGKATKVAVSKGEVAVIPVEVVKKIEEIKKDLKTDAARQTLEEIAIPQIIVTEEKEVTMQAEQAQKAALEFEKISTIIEKKIKEIDQKAADVEQKEQKIESLPERKAKKQLEEIQEIKQDIGILKKDVVTSVEEKSQEVEKEIFEAPEAASEQIKEDFKEIEKIKPKEFEKVVARKEAEEKPVFTKVTIKVDPKEAVIFINGEKKAKGTIKQLNEPGTVLHIRVELEGYVPYEEKIEVGKQRTQEISIKLQRYTRLKIRVEPEDAMILVDGKPKGKKAFEEFYPPGTSLSVSAEREGYITERKKLTVLKEKEQDMLIKLQRIKRPVSWKLAASNKKFIRAIVSQGDRALAADESGRVYCLSQDGKKLWEVFTQNAPNDNSIPVVAGNRVYFSGEKEFLVIGLNDGNVLARANVGKGAWSSHLFGRHIANYKNDIIYPSNDRLLFVDANNLKERKQITIPGNSNSSTSLWNGKIVIANRNGELIIIDPQTDRVEKTIPTGALQPVSLAPSVLDDLCVFAGRKGTVVLVNLKKGKVIWEKKIDKGVFQDITIGKNGVYPFTGDRFYAFSLKDGKTLFGPVPSTCSPFYHDGMIYFGNRSRQFIAADALTGEIIKRYQLESPITAMPALIDSTIIVGTESGDFYGLNPEDM